VKKSLSDRTNYDSIAAEYISSADKKPFTTYYERPFIIKNLPSVQGRKVLDLGCATGFYSKYCSERGADVISVDASKKMIEHTLEVCDNKIAGYVHDISKPFRFVDANSIDVIICSLVLHYLESWDKTLEEFHRMLVPGGKCIISTHHPINDFTHFNKENYFNKSLIEDEWSGFGEPLKVMYFVRPLNEYIQPMVSSNLTLLEIAEPEPDHSLKGIDREMYKRLKTRPAFLFFILEKE